MCLLKDEHGAETDSLLATCANVDAETLHRARDGRRALGVEGDVGALALAAEVHDVVGVLLGELLHLGVEDFSDASL